MEDVIFYFILKHTLERALTDGYAPTGLEMTLGSVLDIILVVHFL